MALDNGVLIGGILWGANIAYDILLCLFVLHVVRKYTGLATVEQAGRDRLLVALGAALVLIPLLTWASSLVALAAHYGVAVPTVLSAAAVLLVLIVYRPGAEQGKDGRG